MARSFDLNLLPVLVRIHDHGSVSAAAAQLGMSQSAISAAGSASLRRARRCAPSRRAPRRSNGGLETGELVSDLFTDQSDEWQV
jgi:hypothetical protein